MIYWIGGVLFLVGAARFYSRGDVVGAAIACAAAVVAILAGCRKKGGGPPDRN